MVETEREYVKSLNYIIKVKVTFYNIFQIFLKF